MSRYNAYWREAGGTWNRLQSEYPITWTSDTVTVSNSPVAFNGGQCGAFYRVRLRVTVNFSNQPSQTQEHYGELVFGAITRINAPNLGSGTFSAPFVTANWNSGATQNALFWQWIGTIQRPFATSITGVVTDVKRQDNLPDNCGNAGVLNYRVRFYANGNLIQTVQRPTPIEVISPDDCCNFCLLLPKADSILNLL